MSPLAQAAGATLAVAAFCLLLTLLRKVTCTMATVQEIKDALDNVATGVDNLEAAIADLKAQVADGGAATEADLQALADKAKAIGDDIVETSDQG